MQKDVKGKFVPGVTRIKYGGAYTDEKEFKAIQSVLDRNWWTIDAEGRLLEKELSEYVYGTEIKNSVTLANSGSSALMLAYAALREKYLPEGAEVITSAVHFPTTISGMYYNRLVPVYVDASLDNLCVDPELIEAAITPKTKAIVAVAIAGNIPNIDRLREIAQKHNLLLMLDNCDGFGGTWNSKPIEWYFDISATSFHAAHILAMGEGGAVITKNPELANIVHAMREWGRIGDTDEVPQNLGLPADYPGRYVFQYMGLNVKPLELQCAMGRVQLQKVNKIKEMRSANFAQFMESLTDLAGEGVIQLPHVYASADPSWFGFPLLVKDRIGLRAFLEDRQIETRTIFGGNITRQPAFKNFGRIHGELPVSDQVMTDGMFVSVHPSVTPEMIAYIVQSIKEYYATS